MFSSALPNELPVVVIGAGAAGIIAAWRAASLGVRVILLEKTNRIGTKILISGGGKCNITHDGPIEEVLRAFRPNEARFIRPACYRFQNHEIVEMLTSRGLDVYTRPDGRIFPTTGTAKDVVAILKAYLEGAGVEIRLDTPVRRISVPPLEGRAVSLKRTGVGSDGHASQTDQPDNLDIPFISIDRGEASRQDGVDPSPVLRNDYNSYLIVETDAETIPARAVILATGGSSYPNSGTTGDGWPWARTLGHTVVRVLAALAPMTLAEHNAQRAGIALRDCVLKARQSKEIKRWRGDLLFTHRGVSGPCALGVSREVSEAMLIGPVTLQVDLLPDLTFEEITKEIVAWSRNNPRKRVLTFLETKAPANLAPELLGDIPADTIASNLPQKARNQLIETLKAWNLGPVQEVVLDKGEVVAGGIALDEVDPQTMESKKCPGLYLCGEVLDIAGPVGGYNLQAAFATGFVAGESAAYHGRPAHE